MSKKMVSDSFHSTQCGHVDVVGVIPYPRYTTYRNSGNFAIKKFSSLVASTKIKTLQLRF